MLFSSGVQNIMDLNVLAIMIFNTDILLNFLLIVLVILLLYAAINHAIVIYCDSDIPGPSALPLFGNLFDLISIKEEDKFAFHQNLRMKYGDMYRLYLGRNEIIYIHNYDLIREMLIEKADIFSDKPDCYPVLSGHGVMFSNGNKIKMFKGLAISAINRRGDRKHAMETILQQEVHGVIECIGLTKGEGFSPKEIMTFISANIVNQILFGFRYKYTDKYFNEVLKNLEPVFNSYEPDRMALFLPFGIFINLTATIHGRKLFKHCHTHSRYGARECNNESFVSRFHRKMYRPDSNSKHYFTDYEKLRCVLDLFFAGAETTSSTLRWMLLYMIEYPDVQEKCVQEIKKVIGDIGEKITLRHKSKLSYISATILEVMRSAVIVPKVTPRVAKENTTLQGRLVKKGSLVLADISSIFMDKTYWNDPEIFKPERFLDAEGNVKKSSRCMFFSTGPRNCPGELLASDLTFLCFSNLIANFKFTKENDNDCHDFRVIFRMSNSCRDYRLRAEPRQK